jgi:hypothetical protein
MHIAFAFLSGATSFSGSNMGHMGFLIRKQLIIAGLAYPKPGEN